MWLDHLLSRETKFRESNSDEINPKVEVVETVKVKESNFNNGDLS